MTIPLINEVTTIFLNIDAHLTRNFLIISQGILNTKSTNLNKVKDSLPNILDNQNTTLPESNYKRLTRFFNIEDSEKKKLLEAILCLSFFLLNIKVNRIKYLALDGTSWENGTKKIHLITLSIVFNGISIPIWWEELDKKGTSNFKERKNLFNTACHLYNLKGMILLADREYIGEKWFKYLTHKGILFVIRVKKNTYRSYVDNQIQGKTALFKHQCYRYSNMQKEVYKKRYSNCGVSKQIEILEEKYSFVIFKNPKTSAEEPLIYFISTLQKKKQIVKAYPIRWSIETCFKHLKSNGFNLEDLNFKNSEKIKLMMAIVVFLYAICIKEGFFQYKQKKKSDWKIYADGSISLSVSVFRKGLSFIDAKIRDLNSFLSLIANWIKYISKLKSKSFILIYSQHVQ